MGKVNKLVLVILACAVAFVATAAFVGLHLFKRSVVSDVCAQLVNAKNQYREEIGDWRRRTDPTENYVKNLRKVDLTLCPSDFRQAFLRYTQEVEKTAPNPRELFKLLLDPKKTAYNWFENGPVVTAWGNVESTALEYGIQFYTIDVKR